MSDKKLIKVIVRDTENIIFEGDADRISSFNELGQFDVYQMHANFISIIKQEIMLYHNNQKVKELKVEQAVMKVKGDTVHIFLGIESIITDEPTSPQEDPKQQKLK